jgi:hypothetical protein
VSRFPPEKYRFALYQGLCRGLLALPLSVHDTADEAADAVRARTLVNIDRSDSVGDPSELAVWVIPVPRA